MRLQSQLTLLLVFVAVVPVAVSGVSSAGLSKASLEEMVEGRLVAQARHLAEESDALVSGALTDLRLSSTLTPMAGLSDAERSGVLWLVYRQQDAFNVVALIGGEGDALVEPVYSATPPDDEQLRGHEVVTDEELQAFARRVPLAAALKAGAAIGPPYTVPGKKHPMIALAVNVGLSDGKSGVIAVELSLAQVHAGMLDAVSDIKGIAFLVDNAGRPFAQMRAEQAPVEPPGEALPEGLAAALSAARGGSTGGKLRETWSGVEMVVAHARLDRLPWTSVVAQDAPGAFAPAQRIIAQTAFWVIVALLCAIAAGLVLARGISGPVDELMRAAQAFQRGEFSHRAPPLQLSEFRRLGEAFNKMAQEVERRDEELRAFNTELQKRVDERTRDLKEAQDQLINSQKMAAVGELGAGVAHEINNPLAGLLGLIQLRMLRTKDDEPTLTALKDMEKEALRIRDIVHNLSALTPQKGTGDQLVEVNRVVDAALSLVARPIVEKRIQVKKDFDQTVPKIRGRSADLQQALLALLANAKNAMPDGGVLTLSTKVIDGKLVKLIVADTGAGIAPEIMDRIFEPFFTTKPVPDAKGLGLALVHRIVQDHGARIAIESQPGRGTSVIITIPAAREKMHLV